MQAALAVLIVSETIHVVGAWQATTASIGSRALSSIYSIGGIVVCVLALAWMRRRDPWAATPAVLIAGLFVLIAGGLAGRHRADPVPDPDHAARCRRPPDRHHRARPRAGLVIAAGMRLRAPPAPRRAVPTEQSRRPSPDHGFRWTCGRGSTWARLGECRRSSRASSKASSGTFVWRDDVCVAFLSIAPLKPGHTLVVPRAEVDHWIDLDPDVNAHLMRVAQELGVAQQRAFSPTRVGLMIAGLEVPHVHLHVVPIDGMHDLDFGNARETTPEALGDAATKLRAALRDAGATGVTE